MSDPKIKLPPRIKISDPKSARKQLPRIILDAPLWCPHCGERHVDEERDGEKWQRRAHTTHRCCGCGGDFDVFVSGEAP